MPSTSSNGSQHNDPQSEDKVQLAAPTWQQQIEADKKAAKTCFRVRVFGLVLFLAGLAMGWGIRSDIMHGATVSEKEVIATPAVLLGALGFIIEPRLLLAGMKDADPRLKAFKVAGYLVVGIGVAIGLYLRFTFFT